MSEDGLFAVTIIAFIGSVFSPYYAWSGRKDPLSHCALNVALYGPRGGAWTMTERSRRRVKIAERRLDIGHSALTWSADGLTIHINETAAPMPTRVCGAVTVKPLSGNDRTFLIDQHGRHRWRPIAPVALVSVDLDQPNTRWSGRGYLDTNDGDEALEDAFREWTWTRLHGSDRDAVILYDTTPRIGDPQRLAMRIDQGGLVEEIAPPPVLKGNATAIWRIPRSLHADAGAAAPIILKTLEDTPFYSRSLIETTVLGERMSGVHESFDGDRLRSAWVKALLPFRMPRHDF